MPACFRQRRFYFHYHKMLHSTLFTASWLARWLLFSFDLKTSWNDIRSPWYAARSRFFSSLQRCRGLAVSTALSSCVRRRYKPSTPPSVKEASITKSPRFYIRATSPSTRTQYHLNSTMKTIIISFFLLAVSAAFALPSVFERNTCPTCVASPNNCDITAPCANFVNKLYCAWYVRTVSSFLPILL